jgi:4-amino-4-deoxy-L-arabinose transferase-like glycosyltransferase
MNISPAEAFKQVFQRQFKYMYKLYNKYKDVEFIYMLPFVLLSLNVRLRYFFYLLSSGKGFPQSDDGIWYINYANSLLRNFKIGLNMDEILYFGYNSLLALLLAIFKDPMAVIFIQAVTSGLSVILVYKIAHMLFNRTTAVIASYLYAYYTWDITLWAMYILSDSFFISLQLLCVYFLLKLIETNKKVYKLLFAATSLYMLLFKPTGVVSLVFILVYILSRMHRKTLIHFVIKYKKTIGVVLTAAVMTFILIYTRGMLDPLISSMQFNAKKVLYNIYARGWIYDKPSPHDYFFKPNYTINVFNSLILSFIINNCDPVLILYGKRVLAFLGRWVWETDLTSITGIKKFAWHVLPSALFLIGTIAAIMNKLFRKASILWLMIFSVFLFCIIFFIDGMYRYKAPAIPFIAVVAAFGAERIIHGSILIAKKYAGNLLGKMDNSHMTYVRPKDI